MNKVFVIAFAAIVLVGCVSTRVGDFTVASTKKMDVAKTFYDVDRSNRVTGDDFVLWILGFALGSTSMERAIDDAIKSDSRAVGLADITLKTYFYSLPFVGFEFLEAEGSVIHVHEEKRRQRRR